MAEANTGDTTVEAITAPVAEMNVRLLKGVGARNWGDLVIVFRFEFYWCGQYIEPLSWTPHVTNIEIL